MLSITDTNQNFSKVAGLAEEKGSVVIMKNNVPRFVLFDVSKMQEDTISCDEDVMSISKRLLQQNEKAYEVPAK